MVGRGFEKPFGYSMKSVESAFGEHVLLIDSEFQDAGERQRL